MENLSYVSGYIMGAIIGLVVIVAIVIFIIKLIVPKKDDSAYNGQTYNPMYDGQVYNLAYNNDFNYNSVNGESLIRKQSLH